jgi:NAD(P)-dependent dehydrogenase (short-subunit alcohol dehydrogenase family)
MKPEGTSYPAAVLVTGALGNVGRVLCKQLGDRGISVIATDRDDFPELQSAGWGNSAAWVTADLESDADRRRLVAQVKIIAVGSLGIVHNASFVGDTDLQGWVGPLESLSSETWNRAMEVGLTASFSVTRDLAAELRQSEGSAVVHVSSIYSRLAPDWQLYEGTAMGNPPAYGVAKAGLEQLTRWLATTLSPRVRVNAVAPGGLARNQPAEFVEKYEAKVPLRRMGTEDDVVKAILFLLSSDAAYITGQTLVVDGGYSIT